MKNQKTKVQLIKTIWRKTKIFFGVCVLIVFGIVFAEDFPSFQFSDTFSTGSGSNGSQVKVFDDTPANNYTLEYWNKGNNSTVIGNYFRGYYYDTMLWFFRLDWSADTSENVRIIGSTGICPSGYGYKLWGYAYSESAGFIDFDYNSNIFVYYCEIDKELHGFGYSEMVGFQNFEGIGFEIIPNIGTVAETTGTGVFVNDTTTINDIVTFTWATSNYDYNTIGGDTINLDVTEESIFYIIK